MPLYLIEINGVEKLVYGKTKRGVVTYALRSLRDQVQVTALTPLEAAVKASEGIRVETVAGTETKVMADDPAEVKRGTKAPVEAAKIISSPAEPFYNLDPPPMDWSEEDERHADDDAFRLAGDPEIEADGFETVHGLDNATERGDIATNEEDVSNVGDSTPA